MGRLLTWEGGGGEGGGGEGDGRVGRGEAAGADVHWGAKWVLMHPQVVKTWAIMLQLELP